MTFGPSHSPSKLAWIPPLTRLPFFLSFSLTLQSCIKYRSLWYISSYHTTLFILLVAADFQAYHWFSAASDYAKEWEVDMYTRAGDKSSISFSDNATGYATWQAIHLFALPPYPGALFSFAHAEYTLSKFPSSPSFLFTGPNRHCPRITPQKRPSLLSSLPTSQEKRDEKRLKHLKENTGKGQEIRIGYDDETISLAFYLSEGILRPRRISQRWRHSNL